MWNAVIKRFVPVMAVAMMLTSSCTSEKERYNNEAAELYRQAETAVNAKDYKRAATLLDSLDAAYPKATGARRDGMHLRAMAQEGLLLAEIEIADSLQVAAQAKGDSLSRLLQRVNNPIESYFVAPGQNVDVHGANGLFCRLMPDGTIYMVSALSSNKVGHTSVTVSTGTQSATTATVAVDGERNDRSSGTEIINYTGSECDTIARLVSSSPEAAYTLTFNGSRSYSMPLPEAQRRALAIMGGIVETVRDVKYYSARSQALRQRLDIVRQQIARTHPDEPAE